MLSCVSSADWKPGAWHLWDGRKHLLIMLRTTDGHQEEPGLSKEACHWSIISPGAVRSTVSFEWFPFTKVTNMSLFCIPREPKGGSPPQAAFKSKDPAIRSCSSVTWGRKQRAVNDGCQWSVALKMPAGMPLGSACMTEAGEMGHLSDNVRLSPLPHGHPALKEEGKRWKGKGYMAKNEAEVQLPTRVSCPWGHSGKRGNLLTRSVEPWFSSFSGINKQNSITLFCDILSVFPASPQSKGLHAENNALSACVSTFQLPLFLLRLPCLQYVSNNILFQEKTHVLSVKTPHFFQLALK